MRIAILTTDNREHFKDYSNETPYFGTAPEALLQGFAMLPDVQVHVLSCTQQRMRSPEKLADRIWFHSLHVPRMGWMSTMYQGCSRAIRKTLRKIQPDIVHGQGTERECAISATRSGFPNVLTIHGNMRLIAQVNKVSPFSFNWLAAQLERSTLPRSLGVVCITRYTQEAVSGLAKRTWVVPNAVDSSFFNVQAAPGSTRTVLCVGNVSYRKNQNAFIRALDEWAPANKIKLLFLGSARKEVPYVAEFFSLVEARPWCVYCGFADRSKLKEQLRDASLLALPSLEDNCPMVVLEAMAAGVPVVAAKVGGVPDLIEEGKTGFFLDPLDAGSIRGGIERGLFDRGVAREVARKAKESALERFHPRVIAQRHLEIYREVLSSLSKD
jgi:glycosyltransferase involved in cell wall biosynthesis